jgi:hypothetical protein
MNQTIEKVAKTYDVGVSEVYDSDYKRKVFSFGGLLSNIGLAITALEDKGYIRDGSRRAAVYKR